MKLVEDTGYPGMKVLQFAFDSREESNYLPHNYPHNCVVYTGTHDNNTVRGWLDDMCEEDNALAEDYMNNADTPRQVTDEMLEKMCHLNKLFGRL